MWDLAALEQTIEVPDDLLRPADRERRDEEHAAVASDVTHRVREHLDGLRRRLVLAATVRRLDQQEVGVGDGRGIANDRRPGPAEIAGEDDGCALRPGP